MLHRLIGGNVLDVPEPGPRPPARPPELRSGQPRALAVLPATFRPPPRLGVTAVVDEVLPFTVGDRNPADPECGHVDDVSRTFVVQ
ncbi:Uncharacterised protein [Mycobacterium tuberculosis]|uniref:Uncharacterized protein n=1 Tax=Mycobacterium tuberculosis TaxID=1773 RepID=A0A655JJQ8_MYCTX|nr:Uncharacterised protein [Mycobacterium tuberculosis]COX35217.1 Uncharacterised protein [Mycobacterium tuberculosis]